MEKLKRFLVEYRAVFVIIGLIICILLQKSQKDRLFEELIGQKEQYVQLSEHAAKLEIQYKSQEDLKAELEKSWKAEKEALQGRVKILSNATYLIREAARQTGSSDLSYSNGPVKYVMNEIKFNDGPPIGYVLIFDDGRVTSKIYNHVIDVKTAVSRNESTGRYSVVSKADYILKSPHLSMTGKNWMNEPHPLKIVGGVAYIDPTEPNQVYKKFHLWSPVLNGGFSAGVDFKSTLGVSLMGYGFSRRDLDWKFIELGANYSKDAGIGFHLTPVLYRPLPNLFQNTYLGLGTLVDKSLTYNPFLSLSIGF